MIIQVCQTAAWFEPKVNVGDKEKVLMFLEGESVDQDCLCYVLCLTIFCHRTDR